MADIGKVGVLGCGLMGHGITQVAAQSGFEVVVREVDQDRLDGGIGRIEKQLARAVEKGRMEQSDADAVRARITPTLEYGDLADSDLVIEAITEDLALKLAMWGEVDVLVKPEAFFATNTSSLPVIDQAAATSRPDRFLGLHFFNPVPVMALLEIVRGARTSDATLQRALEFAKTLGKDPIVVRDSPGFATSRLGVLLGLEAIRMVEQGVASAADIDKALELGYRHPMGPLKLTDLVGLDVRLSIAEHLHRELKSAAFEPPKLLREMVAAGKLGRKSRQGFYKYDA
jgi:3-hydroxybutyryl-CoA dehydrogenase